MMAKQSRHVRWNFEKSPMSDELSEGADSAAYARYHFVVVDDRSRQGIMERIIMPLAKYGEVIPVRSVEGKVRGTRLRYLFASYDSRIKPEMLELHKLGKLVIMDPDLRERKRGNIEDYVAREYG